MQCPKCKTENPDESVFCAKCGTQISESEEKPLPTQTIEAPREELTTGSTFAGRYQIIEELGKIYEQQGDTANALKNYEKFLSLWKDADPGIAEVDDAKERLAALNK